MKKSRLKQISPQKKKHNELYRKAKEEYRRELCAIQKRDPKDGPLCERCLRNQGDELHHKAGRQSFMLWYKPMFAWLCWDCHVGPQGVHFGDKEQAELDGWIVRLAQSQRDQIRLEELPKLYE